jgi:hypothetical protein
MKVSNIYTFLAQKEKDEKKMKFLYGEALKYNENSPEIFLMRAKSLLKLNLILEAKADIVKALEKMPDSKEARKVEMQINQYLCKTEKKLNTSLCEIRGFSAFSAN